MQTFGGARTIGAAFLTAFLAFGCAGERRGGCQKKTLTRLEKALVERGINQSFVRKVLTDPRLECYDIDYAPKKQSEFSMTREEYARHFLTKDRIRRARANLKRYARWFEAAEKRYGVEKEVIAAIIEIESKSGKNIGKYNVPSAFASIFQHRADRRAWAANELAIHLTLAQENRTDPFVKSSRSGALGIPQFLPSTIKAYGTDADGGGFNPNSMPDAIFSVANFLYQHGWKRDDWRAVRKFNHSDNYVFAVMKLAEAIRKR
ncbi:MAG: lytic murein transglycosylase [Candidatus Micrarchaeia archaeon]